MGELFRLYTRQNDKTLLELERTGRILSRSEYVRQYFGDMAEHYLQSYSWFTRQAEKRVPRPPYAEASIWCSISAENCLRPIEGTVVYVLDVPKEQIVFFDEAKWDYVLNRMYLPADAEDAARYAAHLKELGVTSSYDLYRGRYGGMFPGEDERIRESWKRVFTIDNWTVFNVCGNIWEIRKEWIVRIVRPGEDVY
ncbi:MAG: DUF3841 domain-containing protein [Oscillospiraceae bacterium]|nr:DUF3841 domain-containing protein [Oscillospiraceae bacterium]